MRGLVAGLGLVPVALLLGAWVLLIALGGYDCVGVLTGMAPPGVPLDEAVALGLSTVAVHLVGVVGGPPLLVAGLVWAGLDRVGPGADAS